MPDSSRAQLRRDAGLCVTCGQRDAATGRSKCDACLEAARSAAAERREHAAAKGLCEACLRRKRVPGRGNRCAACADKYVARQNERMRARRKAGLLVRYFHPLAIDAIAKVGKAMERKHALLGTLHNVQIGKRTVVCKATHFDDDDHLVVDTPAGEVTVEPERWQEWIRSMRTLKVTIP